MPTKPQQCNKAPVNPKLPRVILGHIILHWSRSNSIELHFMALSNMTQRNHFIIDAFRRQSFRPQQCTPQFQIWKEILANGWQTTICSHKQIHLNFYNLSCLGNSTFYPDSGFILGGLKGDELVTPQYQSRWQSLVQHGVEISPMCSSKIEIFISC